MKLKSELCTETLIFKEPSLKHYKHLLKSLYGETPNKETFVETVIDIASEITSRPVEYFQRLNVIDFFLFLLDLRMIILGKDCSVLIKQEDKEMKLVLDLDLLKQDLIDTFKELINKQISLSQNVSINFNCPSFYRLLDYSLSDVADGYLFFIKKATIQNGSESIELEIQTYKQSEELFNKLMPALSVQIIDHYGLFVKTCSELNLLSRYKLKSNQTLPFNPTIETIIWLCQLFFNESLSSIYDNLFYLSYYGKLDLNYVENGTVGEYIYFTNMLKNVLNSKNGNSQPAPPTPDDEQFNQSPLVDL